MEDFRNFMLGMTLLVLLAVGGCFGIPKWHVWEQGLAGEAQLRKAEHGRKVLVAQAAAERDAAVLRAEAIKTVGQAAQDFPEYREQEFIGSFAHALESGKVQQIIYVPTEANIPIVEAKEHRITEAGSRKRERE